MCRWQYLQAHLLDPQYTDAYTHHFRTEAVGEELGAYVAIVHETLGSMGLQVPPLQLGTQHCLESVRSYGPQFWTVLLGQRDTTLGASRIPP